MVLASTVTARTVPLSNRCWLPVCQLQIPVPVLIQLGVGDCPTEPRPACRLVLVLLLTDSDARETVRSDGCGRWTRRHGDEENWRRRLKEKQFRHRSKKATYWFAKAIENDRAAVFFFVLTAYYQRPRKCVHCQSMKFSINQITISRKKMWFFTTIVNDNLIQGQGEKTK